MWSADQLVYYRFKWTDNCDPVTYRQACVLEPVHASVINAWFMIYTDS